VTCERLLNSRILKSDRLLEKVGVIVSQEKDTGQGHIYVLTAAGEALRPIIEAMGVWAQQWGSEQIAPEDLDDALLMWGMRRRINLEAAPTQKIVLQFDFYGLTKGRRTQRSWWLVIEDGEVDVCQKNPGFEVDVLITADLSVFTHIWMGLIPLYPALRKGSVVLEGDRNLVRQVPSWLYLNGEKRYGMGIDPSISQVMLPNQCIAVECQATAE
jgi:hypothetical protein